MIVSREFFLEWEMFQTKLQGKSKRIFYVRWSSPPPENRAVYGSAEKCGRVGQATNDNIIGHMRFAC